MPEPTEYRILRNLQTALLGIAIAAGYFYDVADLAVKLDANQDVETLVADDAPRPFIILDPQPETREYSPANRVTLTWPVHIYWVGTADDTTDEARIRTFFRGCADVEKAIAQDISRGGLATDTRILDRDIASDGVVVWAVIRAQIRSHRVYGLA